MSNDEKKAVIEKALNGQDVFKVLKVDHVNHRPHPFMIGPKHVAHAADHHMGRLGEETCKLIPCAWKGCTSSYEEHTSDNVCFLQLRRNATQDEANKIMVSLREHIGDQLVDGFAFVETEENFTVK